MERTGWVLPLFFAAVACADAKAGPTSGGGATTPTGTPLPTPPPPPEPDSPAFVTDSDGDGKVDAGDPCPSYPPGMTAPADGTTRSRDPLCYVAMTWLLDSPITSRYGIVVQGTSFDWGSWYKTNDCYPVMAYPVLDDTSDHKVVRGVVLAGVPQEDTGGAHVLSKAQVGDPWPDDGPAARCILSMDYAGTVDDVVPVSGATLATAYVSWSTTFDLDVPDRYVPRDGLGLVRPPYAGALSNLATKDPFEPTLQRLAFTRGAIYGPALGTEDRLVHVIKGGPTKAATDPTHSSTPETGWTVSPVHATDVKPDGITSHLYDYRPPASWRLVPTGFDAALRKDRAAMDAAVAGKTRPVGFVDAVEGVPLGLFFDDRWFKNTALVKELKSGPSAFNFVASTGAETFAPLDYIGSDYRFDPWIIVPASIANLSQHLDSLYWGQPLRPAGPASYAQSKSSFPLLVEQEFYGREPKEDGLVLPDPVRAIEAQWPGDGLPAAVGENSFRYGSRWTSNAGRTDCFYYSGRYINRYAIAPVPYPYSTGSDQDVIAESWCPADLYDFWISHPDVNTLESARDHACGASNAAISDLEGYFGSAVEDPSTLGCLGGSLEGDCCAGGVVCTVLTLGACAPVASACCALTYASSDDRDSAFSCVEQKFKDHYKDVLPNDIHWVDLDSPMKMIPFVGFMSRNGIVSDIANSDNFWNHGHQASDWNWVVQDPLRADPDSKVLGYRWWTEFVPYAPPGFSYKPHFEFFPFENEIEALVPVGQWTDGPHLDAEFRYRGFRPGDLGFTSTKSDHVPNADWLAEVWPNDYCDDFQINRGDTPEFSGNPSIPSLTCGNDGTRKSYSGDEWPVEFGRGMFQPIDDTTLDPSSDASKMDGGYTLGLQDWGSRPHRLAFLGRPIIDCGHPEDNWHVEVHPPHVLTMDIAEVTEDGDTPGVVVAAFGWVNITVPGTLEFDLWPRPRPGANAQLVTKGPDVELGTPAGGPGAAFPYGYVVDQTAPQAGPEFATLSCNPEPLRYPNHLHCTYTDKAGGPRAPTIDAREYGEGTPDADEQRNMRFAPYYATSRFELRFFLGWRTPTGGP